MREIKRTNNDLIDNLALLLSERGIIPVKQAAEIGPSRNVKNIVGNDTKNFPTLVSNDITLSNLTKASVTKND